MPQDFSGKVALVSGAASGIGRATSDLLSACGASVFEVDIKYTRGRVERSESNVARFGADLTQEAQARESVESCVNTFGALHVVCNCAGIEMKGNVVELPTESFEKVIETNVKSVFLVSKYAVPHLLKNERSALVNVSSALGIQPIPGVDAYAASKGAIIALTKAMSKNWAKNGLRVNCVAPGPIDTPLLRRFVDEPILDFVKQTMIPMGRLGRTDEIASVIAYLAGDESSFVNGAIFTANGGLVG